MSFGSAAFFSWVQGAPFYVEVHAQAVDLLPPGNGKTWLDVGCGPGLVARLAGDRGYNALGIDNDPEMIRFALHSARGRQQCRLEVGDLKDISSRHSADVVSAASLLFVVPDPGAAIQQLWDCVRPGGKLLVIETTEQMTQGSVQKVRNTVQPGRRLALELWARTRNGRAIAAETFSSLSALASTRTPLLGGLVQAWIFTKELTRTTNE